MQSHQCQSQREHHLPQKLDLQLHHLPKYLDPVPRLACTKAAGKAVPQGEKRKAITEVPTSHPDKIMKFVGTSETDLCKHAHLAFGRPHTGLNLAPGEEYISIFLSWYFHKAGLLNTGPVYKSQEFDAGEPESLEKTSCVWWFTVCGKVTGSWVQMTRSDFQDVEQQHSSLCHPVCCWSTGIWPLHSGIIQRSYQHSGPCARSQGHNRKKLSRTQFQQDGNMGQVRRSGAENMEYWHRWPFTILGGWSIERLLHCMDLKEGGTWQRSHLFQGRKSWMLTHLPHIDLM